MTFGLHCLHFELLQIQLTVHALIHCAVSFESPSQGLHSLGLRQVNGLHHFRDLGWLLLNLHGCFCEVLHRGLHE